MTLDDLLPAIQRMMYYAACDDSDVIIRNDNQLITAQWISISN